MIKLRKSFIHCSTCTMTLFYIICVAWHISNASTRGKGSPGRPNLLLRYHTILIFERSLFTKSITYQQSNIDMHGNGSPGRESSLQLVPATILFHIGKLHRRNSRLQCPGYHSRTEVTDIYVGKFDRLPEMFTPPQRLLSPSSFALEIPGCNVLATTLLYHGGTIISHLSVEQK